MVQSQVTLCTHNELFYLQNAERKERGGEIVERKRKLEKKEILDRPFVYVQEEGTGEYNCPLERNTCRKDSMSMCVSVCLEHTPTSTQSGCAWLCFEHTDKSKTHHLETACQRESYLMVPYIAHRFTKQLSILFAK
jgi:hypothetical protein